MRLIERYNWMHVFITSIIGAALIATGVHFMLPGHFTARSSLLLNDGPDILGAVASQEQAAPEPASIERLQAILVSREIRERIIEETSLQEKFEVDRGETLEALTEMSVIKPIGT